MTSAINSATSGLQNATQVNSLISTALSPYSTTTQMNTANTNQIITNSNINDGSINTTKLVLPSSNQTTTYFRGDGTFTSVPSFTNSFSANVNANSYQINSLLDPSSAQDAATKNYVDTATNSTTLGTNLYSGLLGTGIYDYNVYIGSLGHK